MHDSPLNVVVFHLFCNKISTKDCDVTSFCYCSFSKYGPNSADNNSARNQKIRGTYSQDSLKEVRETPISPRSLGVIYHHSFFERDEEGRVNNEYATSRASNCTILLWRLLLKGLRIAAIVTQLQ